MGKCSWKLNVFTNVLSCSSFRRTHLKGVALCSWCIGVHQYIVSSVQTTFASLYCAPARFCMARHALQHDCKTAESLLVLHHSLVTTSATMAATRLYRRAPKAVNSPADTYRCLPRQGKLQGSDCNGHVGKVYFATTQDGLTFCQEVLRSSVTVHKARKLCSAVALASADICPGHAVRTAEQATQTSRCDRM